MDARFNVNRLMGVLTPRASHVLLVLAALADVGGKVQVAFGEALGQSGMCKVTFRCALRDLAEAGIVTIAPSARGPLAVLEVSISKRYVRMG